VPLIGFKSCSVYYSRGERFAGESKYPLKKMLFFALDGITSFSIVPLRIITLLGFFIFLFSLIVIIWIFIEKYMVGSTIQGWSSIMVSIYLMGEDSSYMSLGIIGEYIGRIYQQSRNRPRYIIA